MGGGQLLLHVKRVNSTQDTLVWFGVEINILIAEQQKFSSQ